MSARPRKGSPRKPRAAKDELDPSLAEWRARTREPGPQSERFRRLLDDLARDETEETPSTCDEFEPLLQAYDGARRRGARKPRGAARLERHLKTCANCREKLEALSVMQDESRAVPRHAPVNAPRPKAESPERVRIVPLSSLREKRNGVRVHIAAALLAPPQSALATRGDDARERRLLLNETIQINSEPYQLEVYLPQPHADTEALRLCADVTADAPRRIRITLHWGAQQRVQHADDAGHTCFDDLPSDVLADGDQSLRFEVEIVE